MNRVARAGNALGGRLMALTGWVGELGTIGARTGQRRRAPIGYVARPDGSLLVGSERGNRGWAANLRANPAATFTVKGVERRYRARLVGLDERTAAIAALRARFGRWAARTNWGDLFVLEPEA
ncbi:MAG: nitroreductase family deazaflavin-dependent oxidoreductase [Chloroflexi bacterium]|nr:nitroreductase family deazaflavin-dependent oxidoreductase [Chloroflexota bacterium]